MMKRNLLERIIIISIICIVTTRETKAQEEKPFIFGFEAYYGFPNLFSDIVENTYENQFNFTDYALSDFGPTGVRGEIFINKHIAFGIDANYATSKLEWINSHSEYDPFSGTYIKTKDYHYRIDVTRFRLLSRFNAHFVTTRYFDWYMSTGLGYNSSQVTLTTDDPSKSYRQENHFPFATLPFCMRVGMGGRYYFVKNAGVGFELGFGGPLLSLGLNARF